MSVWLWVILIGIVFLWAGLGEAVKAQQPVKKERSPQVVNMKESANKIPKDEPPLTIDTYNRLKAASKSNVRFT